MKADKIKMEMHIIKIKKRNIEYIKKLLLMFCFIFEMPVFSVITTRRLVWLIAIYTILKQQSKLKSLIKQINTYAILIFGIGMVYCVILLFVILISSDRINGNVYIESYSIIIIFCNIVLFSLYCFIEYKDVYELYKVYIPIMIFQSIIIYITVLNTQFRLFIYNNFYNGDDRFKISMSTGKRIVGIYLHSATGSIVLATACVILTYLAVNKKLKISHFILQYAFITGATMFIGRTGFYLEIILLFIYLILTPGLFKKILYLLIIILLSLLLIRLILENIDENSAAYFWRWGMAIFDVGRRERNIDIYTSMQKISFTSEMIFGTGVMRGWTPGGAYIYSDSGYVMFCSAVGVVGSIIYYGSFLALYCMSLCKKKDRQQYILFIILIGIGFFIELKEPFTSKSVYYVILYLLEILYVKENYELNVK